MNKTLSCGPIYALSGPSDSVHTKGSSSTNMDHSHNWRIHVEDQSGTASHVTENEAQLRAAM